MKGKILVSLTSAIIAACFSLAEGQQAAKIPRIGFTNSSRTPAEPSPQSEAFRSGLRELGYEEGKNILIESRYAEGRLDLMPALVNDLVLQKVDVILAPNNVVIRAAKEATKTIPIVMVTTVDPV